MNENITTAEVIQLMLEECSKPSKRVADECGINYSTFMRKVSPVDSGTSLSIEEMLKYIDATGSEAILDHLCKRRGRMYVPFPKGIRKGTDPKQDVNAFASKCNKMMGKLFEFVANPINGKVKDELMELIRIHQGDTENMRRRVRDDNLHQTEMDF